MTRNCSQSFKVPPLGIGYTSQATSCAILFCTLHGEVLVAHGTASVSIESSEKNRYCDMWQPELGTECVDPSWHGQVIMRAKVRGSVYNEGKDILLSLSMVNSLFAQWLSNTKLAVCCTFTWEFQPCPAANG